MPDDPVILDYAKPVSSPAPMGLVKASRACTHIASCVGLMMLVFFAITGSLTFAMLGLIWIYVGGAITFVGFVLSTIFGAIAWSRKFPEPATKSKVRSTIVYSLIPIPVAAFCFIAGIGLIHIWDRH